LDGWLKTAARFNPITYVIEAMRALINQGWDTTSLLQGVLACLILALAMYSLALFALQVRTRRK
jgi:ABC-2 type transport system permease protein